MKDNIKQTDKEPLNLWQSCKIIFWSLKYVISFPIRVIIHLILTSIVPIIKVIIPVLLGQVLIDNVLKKSPLDITKFNGNTHSQIIYDKLSNLPYEQMFMWTVIAIVVLEILFALAEIACRLWGRDLQNRMVQKVRSETCLGFLSFNFKKEQFSDSLGETAFRMNVDTQAISEIYVKIISNSWAQIFTLAIIFYAMWTINPTLCFVPMIFFPVYLLIIALCSKMIRKSSRNQKEWSSGLISKISELFFLSNEINMSDRKEEEKKDYENKSWKSLKFYWMEEFTQVLLMYLVKFVIIIGLGVFIVVGVNQVWAEKITIGQWITLFAYLKQINDISFAWSRKWSNIQLHVVSMHRIKQLLKKPPKLPLRNENIAKKIHLQKISQEFERGIKILNEITYDFEKGFIHVVSGPVGSGKTTLLNCISKIDDLTDGKILIDAIDYSKINTNKLIGYLFQESRLFPTTILDNILYGDDRYKSITKYSKLSEYLQQKIKLLCEEVGLSEYVNKLENKYDTKIKEDNSNLSSGQKQKILLARMIHQDKKILLLDEPTSSLSEQDESKLMSTLNRIKKDKIIIVTSHIKLKGDKYILLENGKFHT